MELLRQRPDHIHFGHQSQADQDPAQHAAHFLLRANGTVKVSGAQFACTREPLTQTYVRLVRWCLGDGG